MRPGVPVRDQECRPYPLAGVHINRAGSTAFRTESPVGFPDLLLNEALGKLPGDAEERPILDIGHCRTAGRPDAARRKVWLFHSSRTWPCWNSPLSDDSGLACSALFFLPLAIPQSDFVS